MYEAESRDCCQFSTALQVTDMRTQKEMGTYRGHNRDVTCASWHPLHEELFASGGYDGSLLYWFVSSPTPQASSLLSTHCTDFGMLHPEIFVACAPTC